MFKKITFLLVTTLMSSVACTPISSLQKYKIIPSSQELKMRRCFIFIEALNAMDYELLKHISTPNFLYSAGDIALTLEQFTVSRKRGAYFGEREKYIVMGCSVSRQEFNVEVIFSTTKRAPRKENYIFTFDGDLIETLHLPGYS